MAMNYGATGIRSGRETLAKYAKLVSSASVGAVTH